MRLLQTRSFQFEDFFDSKIPRYAILSHRWGEKEVSYKDFRKRTAQPGPGLRKIERCCQLAAERGFDWVWIDTCCIDKRSSAELSEAINSMFKWYENAAECYVHLADVEHSHRELSLKNDSDKRGWRSEGWPSLREKFRKSTWFTRGWTLQELLASRRLVFYDATWIQIGGLGSLLREVSAVTRIPVDVLSHTKNLFGMPALKTASVAKKMSWASFRETSRGEDMSYCLLGLFEVNMPLLYGEGAEKAFIRLQTEIMKNSDDESIFAWTSGDLRIGMLASGPNAFADSGDILFNYWNESPRPPYVMTSKGLEFAVPKKYASLEHIPVLLGCTRTRDQGVEWVCIILSTVSLSSKTRCRTSCDTLKPSDLFLQEGEFVVTNFHGDLEETEFVYVAQDYEEYY